MVSRTVRPLLNVAVMMEILISGLLVSEPHTIFGLKQVTYPGGVIAAAALYLVDLGIDERAVPPSLDKGEDEPLLAVAPRPLEEIAVEEICGRPPEQRLAGIRMLLAPLRPGLVGEMTLGLTRRESILEVEKLGRLTHGIVDMLLAEPREVIEVMVTKIVIALMLAPTREHHMLIHKALLIAALACAEQAQYLDRVDAVAHPAVHEYVAALEHNTCDIRGHRG